MPPYGRRINGQQHIWVYGGQLAWPKVKLCDGAAMVMPDGVDPFAFTWPVSCRVVTVSWSGGATKDVRRLVDALLDAGADRVLVVDPLFYDSADPELWRWDV